MRDNDIRIAPHFSLREFQCPCCLTVRLRPELLIRLEALRGLWGPVRITSGYRCPSHNTEVGGSPISRHLIGCAVDVAVSADEIPRFLSAVDTLPAFTEIRPHPGQHYVHIGVDR